MGRKKLFPPTIHPHSSGQAYVRIRQDGTDHNVYLGPYGSDEAQAAYHRLCAEMLANGGQLPPPAPRPGLTVAALVARFWDHAEVEYQNSTERIQFRWALGPVLHLYADIPAADFGPRALKAVQRLLATGYDHPQHGRRGPYSRKVLNRHVVRTRTVFRWAESEQLVPPGTFETLRTVKGFSRGAAGVRDRPDVPPVPEEHLMKTLPYLGRIVRALATIQLLTGARPGEVVDLRGCDLQRTDRVELAPGSSLQTGGKVWVFRRARHKLTRLGRQRVLLFGPQAQAILMPFLEGRAPDAHLFSPREAIEEWLSSRGRSTRRGKTRQPGEHYTVSSYQHAVTAGCRKAGVPLWAPRQLRHNAASRLGAEFGPEVARIVLGHHGLDMTRRYMLDDLQKGVEAIAACG